MKRSSSICSRLDPPNVIAVVEYLAPTMGEQARACRSARFLQARRACRSVRAHRVPDEDSAAHVERLADREHVFDTRSDR